MQTGTHRGWVVGALLLAATLIPWLPRLSVYSDQMGVLDRWSYDWLHALRGTSPCGEVVIIEMDESSYGDLKQRSDALWDRELHVRLLHVLRRDGAKVVVFDVFFTDPGSADSDQALAREMKEHGNVAIAADLVDIRRAGVAVQAAAFPVEPIRSAAAGIGLVTPWVDTDGTVRRHFLEVERQESLPWAAARLAGSAALAEMHRSSSRWMNYYGPPRESLPRMRYADALGQGDGYFKGKYVFIGGSPRIKKPGERTDSFRTPHTAWNGTEVAGVDLVAVNFLNLLRGDALSRLSPLTEFLLLSIWGFMTWAACVVANGRTRAALLLSVAASVLAAGVVLPVFGHVWFSWLLPLAVQLPAGSLYSFWARGGLASRRPWKEAVPTARLVGGESADGRGEPGGAVALAETPVVADHTLLRRVGTGAYGEVWVARNALGILHAVKVIRRRVFASSEPFEREFRGITRFMPISRSHPGFVHVLQAGPEEVTDYFYYVMELADDAAPGADNLVEGYQPTTLASQLRSRKRLPPEECLSLGLQMTDALSHLHKAQLIHRDIKPSNIIFVRNRPKLADIGLVTRMAENPREVSFLGTRGYLAPEGPGTPEADIYSLGKVLYEAFTGLDREQFPSLPSSLLEAPSAALAELNQIVLRACEVNPAQRYQSAAEFHQKLAGLGMRLRVLRHNGA